MKKAVLRLQDGTEFAGYSFGYEEAVAGEVVFNTAMVGYPESMTDPSFAGQIMVFTYPLVGNYGVPAEVKDENGLSRFMESDKIHVRAIVVGDYSPEFSHWNANESLESWMKRHQIPGITGVDTRELTKVLREKGVMMGAIVPEGCEVPKAQYEGVNFASQVSCTEVITYQPTAEPIGKRVVLVDCGVRHSVIRTLLAYGVEVMRVPWNYDFNELEFDGLFLANGPGDPETCAATVENIRKFLKNPTVRPCMGICMGNQLLAKAAGARIYKLKYGHHGINQPVRQEGTTNCYVTAQNHGYAVDASTMNNEWEPMFVNMNDGSNEGVRHKTNPWFSAQFHPETSAGAADKASLFEMFINKL